MPARIDPEAFYTEFDVRQLGLATESELKRARQSGKLRWKEIGRGHRAYLGSWLIAWLMDGVNG
jgi:hypothetical protein